MEGVITKRADSVYQPGKRTGLWSKYRLNLDQEFVIGGYIPSNLGLDSIVIGSTKERICTTPPASGQASFRQRADRSSTR
jgi:ATP-dependent DNA ligase